MDISKLHRNFIRSTGKVRSLTSLFESDLQNTVGGKSKVIPAFRCFPCPGSGCFIYIDFDCFLR